MNLLKYIQIGVCIFVCVYSKSASNSSSSSRSKDPLLSAECNKLNLKLLHWISTIEINFEISLLHIILYFVWFCSFSTCLIIQNINFINDVYIIMTTFYFLYYWQVPKRYPLIPKFGSIFGYFDWESVQNIFFCFYEGPVWDLSKL